MATMTRADRQAQLISLSMFCREALTSTYRMTVCHEPPMGCNDRQLIDEILAREYPVVPETDVRTSA
jgi:hypothetical protein